MNIYSGKFKIHIFISCIILATLACFGWFYFVFTKPIGFTYLYLVILYLVTVLVSYYFSWLVLAPSTNYKKCINYTSIISIVIVPTAMYILSLTFLDITLKVEKSKFEKAHLKEQEGSSSFYRVQQFAKKYYNAPLVLGGYEESWAHTNLYIPQSSPASLRSSTGYCTVNFSKPNMRYMYNQTSKSILYDDWEMLLLAHELSHCLDRAVDLPVGLGEAVIRL